ncbi:42327_t:CDS:2 [Gigaspora margarita]|uniref:42327_t:CDS:1 n=1 Tax=Gigaspora margarita TaxID=4874 RepID=A0ABN7WH36_GIGMA|nr:42327_t:CDS:2 [Gigaspora margarita]
MISNQAIARKHKFYIQNRKILLLVNNASSHRLLKQNNTNDTKEPKGSEVPKEPKTPEEPKESEEPKKLFQKRS